jgi:hypothetical protein
MASPIDDPRYALARMMREQRQPSGMAMPTGPAPSKTSVALSRQASDMMVKNPTLSEKIRQIQQGTAKAEPKGALGAILGNPITRTALKPLEALALPGKVVIGGLREGIDAFDGNDETKFSFGDFKKNIKDPTFGFGKAFDIDTGNKWFDRAIGFAGDVLLDPITYMTFGAGKFAGYAGRLDLAKIVLSNTGDARLANQVQRFGRAAIKDPAILEAAGANRHGLYFLGKHTRLGNAQQGLRIPGTGAIGQLSDNALAKLRISAMGTKGGKFVQKVTLPGDATAARQAMLQGQAGDEASAALIGVFTASPTARKAAGVALKQAEMELMQKFQRAEPLGFEGYSNQLYKYIEDPSLLDAAPQQIKDAVEEWTTGFFKRYDDEIGQRMAEVDPNHKYTGVTNYFPRMQSEAAVNYRSNRSNPYSRSLNEMFDRDPLEGGQNFKSRTMEVDDDWFGHKLTVEDIKSIDKLNELARPHMGGKDFFETDLRVVAPKYVRAYSDEVGLLAKHKHLADTGFWKRAEAVEMGEEFLDKELVNSVKKNIKTLSQDLAESYKASSKAYIGLTNALEEARAGKLKELQNLEGAGGELGGRLALVEAQRAIDDVLNGSLTLSADQLQLVADNLGSLKNKYAALFGAEVKNGKLVLKGTDQAAEDAPMVLDGLVGYLDNLVEDVQRLADDIIPLEKNLVGKELQAAHDAATQQVKLASERIKQSQERVEMIMEFGNQIESGLEALARGEATDNLPAAVNEVLSIIARDGDLSNSTVKKLQETALGARGETQKFIRERMNDTAGLPSDLTRASKVSKDAVAKMEITDFYNDLPGMFTNEHTLTHVREMGLYALLKDERLYGTDVPALLVPMRNQLIEQLRLADEAEAFIEATARQQSQGERLSSAKIFETQWRPAFDRAVRYDEEITSMDEFLSRFRAGLQGNEEVLNSPVNWASLENDLAKFPWLADLEPNRGATEFIEDLMGATEVVPMRNSDTFELGGRTVSDQQFVRSSYDEEMTYADLLNTVENRLSEAEEIMSGDFFQFGSGANTTIATGYAVLNRYKRYQYISRELSSMRRSRAAAQESFKKKNGYYDLDLGTSAGRARRDALDLQANSVWQSKDAADKYTELLDNQREISGGASVLKPEWFGSAAKTKADLADSLMSYTIVSEVHSRWSAMSEYMSAFGVVPTQRMFAEVTNAVGAKFMPVLERELASTNVAIDIVTRLDKQIAQTLSDSAGNARPAEVFRNFVESLSVQEREVLSNAVGTKINWGADPRELRLNLSAYKKQKLGPERVAKRVQNSKEIKQIKDSGASTPASQKRLGELRSENNAIAKASREAENEFYRDVVSPWFRRAYPGKPVNKRSMDAALKREASTTTKGAKRMFETPWAEGADAVTLKRFFEDLIGTSEIQGRGHSLGGKANALDEKVRSLRKSQRRFKQMLSPDLNIEDFFDDPTLMQRTPTFYSYLLQRSSDALSRRIALKQDVNFNILDIRSQQTSAGATALEKTQQVANLAGSYRGVQAVQVPKEVTESLEKAKKALERLNSKGKLSANEQARKAKVEEAIVKIEKQIKGYNAQPKGVQPDYIDVARNEIQEYNRLMESPMYGKAKADEQMIQAMEQLSGYELHKYSTGFVNSEGVVATMPNGNPIIFSEAEWRSLYAGRRNKVEADVRRTNLRSDIKDIERSIQAKSVEREQAVNFLAASEANLDRVFRNRTQLEEARAAVERAKETIDEIDAFIKGEMSRRESLLLDVESFNAAVQNSALMKMRILTEGRKGQAPVFDHAGLQRFANYEHPAQRAWATNNYPNSRQTVEEVLTKWGKTSSDPKTVKARQANLMKVWKSTEEYKFLQKLSKSEQNTFVEMYKFMDESVDSMIAFRDEFDSRIQNMIAKGEPIGEDIRMLRGQAQEQAQQGADVLQVETGRFPVDAEGNQLPKPTTPAEMDAYAASLAEQAKPTGPRTQPVEGTPTKVPGAQEIDDQIAVKTAELEELKLANNQGMLDEAGYKRMIAVEKNIGDLNRKRLTRANLPEADEALVRAENEQYGALLAEREARSAVDAWEKPSQRVVEDPRVRGMQKTVTVPGERTVLLKQARDAYASRFRKAEDTTAIIKALEAQDAAITSKMAAISGSVDSFWRDIYKQRGIAQALREEIDGIDALIRSLPSDEARKTLKAVATSRGAKPSADQIDSTLRAYRAWSGENKRVFELLAKNPDDPVYVAWAAAAVADARLIDLELTKPYLLNDLLNASTAVWKTTVLDTFDKGYEKAARESGLLDDMKRVDARLFPSLYGNSEAVDLLKSVTRLREPGVIDDLSRFMRGYTGFFKSYATLSPGFHVRNGISNTFAVFSAGADIRNMREGFRLWRLMDDTFRKGGSLEDFVKSLPAEQQEYARVAAETVLGLGNGKVDNAMEGFVRGGTKIRDNKLLDASRTSGSKLEGSARFMLAYDSVARGMNPDEAFNRTRRYLIDYNEKSLLDEQMRDIVPFWTWMSRNLPLQIVNRWMNPKPYLIYEKFARNLNQELEGDEVTPEYLRKGGAINIGKGNYIVPDLPFSRIEDQISDLTNPSALVGYINPGLKVPLELVMNKNTFTGENFNNKYVPLRGPMAMLLPALQAAGQVEYNAQGEPMAREKAVYALTSTIPFLDRAQRLTAPGTPGANAARGFLGVPIRNVTQGAQDAERYSRLAQLQAMEARRKNLGE